MAWEPSPTRARDAVLIDGVVEDAGRAAAADAARVAKMIEFQDLLREEGQRTLGGGPAGQNEAETAVHELSLALMLPRPVIEAELARGRRIRSRSPRVWEAWSQGRIATAKVAAIDATLKRLGLEESVIALDEQVVPVAEHRTLSQLRAWLNRFVARVEAARGAERARRARADRAVWTTPGVDAMAWQSAYLPALEAAQIESRLNQLARAAGAADPRSMDQRRADAYVDLLLGRTANGYTNDAEGTSDTGTAGPSATIAVVVPIQSLAGASEVPGELIDRSAPVPADQIRELAGTPGTLFWRLLSDERGRLLDVTELGRFASRRLGFAIGLRDGTSVFPTSNVPAARCDLDHTIPHGQGPTSAANLGPLDRRAHNVKTRGGLRLRQLEPGEFEWTTRTGRHYTRSAEPLPTAGWLDHLDLPTPHPCDPDPPPSAVVGIETPDRPDPPIDWAEQWDPSWDEHPAA